MPFIIITWASQPDTQGCGKVILNFNPGFRSLVRSFLSGYKNYPCPPFQMRIFNQYSHYKYSSGCIWYGGYGYLCPVGPAAACSNTSDGIPAGPIIIDILNCWLEEDEEDRGESSLPILLTRLLPEPEFKISFISCCIQDSNFLLQQCPGNSVDMPQIWVACEYILVQERVGWWWLCPESVPFLGPNLFNLTIYYFPDCPYRIKCTPEEGTTIHHGPAKDQYYCTVPFVVAVVVVVGAVAVSVSSSF